MTERTGGSDVGASETKARFGDGTWRLYGTKWFTSATTSQMALTLGRPEGNPAGGKGLALFYVEMRDEKGQLQNISINRLKDKLGTRKIPTAELSLEGTPAVLVSDARDGIKNITPMLSLTRTWNAFGSVWIMRRGVALAQSYAKVRSAFGGKLIDKPLHLDTLAQINAKTQGATLLAFRCAEILGKIECDEASDEEESLFRILTPIAKLTTAKQAVAVCSEAVECFGGAGYIEDTGVPRLIADAQVLPIWEGTTNILSLDTLRALAEHPKSFEVFTAELARLTAEPRHEGLAAPSHAVASAAKQCKEWLHKHGSKREQLETGARRFALTLGKAMELALAIDHANWRVSTGQDASRAIAVAQRLAFDGVCEFSGQEAPAAELVIGR